MPTSPFVTIQRLRDLGCRAPLAALQRYRRIGSVTFVNTIGQRIQVVRTRTGHRAWWVRRR